ncbi:SMI1/KNR4 family protein [Tenacibaculum amylolyticum]|uniref:SMI1/KNR4 family protein n=1 Tax=Tenacibaculum amylolyticum TaxID=104269 RepID=UPI003895BB3C
MIEKEYIKRVTLVKPVSKELLEKAERKIKYRFPEIFKYFYTIETNGIYIGNKILYSVFNPEDKKTTFKSLQIINNPFSGYWFKYHPEFFNDYVIIGADLNNCYAISKTEITNNPTIYICKNPNTKSKVIIEKLNFDLKQLIYIMARNSIKLFT